MLSARRRWSLGLSNNSYKLAVTTIWCFRLLCLMVQPCVSSFYVICAQCVLPASALRRTVVVRPGFHPLQRKLLPRAPRPNAKTRQCPLATGHSAILPPAPPHLRGTWPPSSKRQPSLPTTIHTSVRTCWIPSEKPLRCCRSSSPSVEPMATINLVIVPRQLSSTTSPWASPPRPAPSPSAHGRIGARN